MSYRSEILVVQSVAQHGLKRVQYTVSKLWRSNVVRANRWGNGSAMYVWSNEMGIAGKGFHNSNEEDCTCWSIDDASRRYENVPLFVGFGVDISEVDNDQRGGKKCRFEQQGDCFFDGRADGKGSGGQSAWKKGIEGWFDLENFNGCAEIP